MQANPKDTLRKRPLELTGEPAPCTPEDIALYASITDKVW